MVHLEANRDHRLRPIDFRTSHHPISAFSAQEKYGATGAFSSNRICPDHTHIQCEKWLEAVARRPKPSGNGGKYRLYESRGGERDDRRCRFAFSLTSRERE
jgi:hypothetical protein